ncbi:DUF2304 domain-containing protein [Candidatus Woesearchaeota archaeon]|nr:MAG: DUF2304 domain-containing protein [Candidatus Woesearchaeota archaeon]
MIIGLQIVGMLFALVMVYLTFLHFKRGDYLTGDFVLWNVIWFSFLFIVLFPKTVYGVMETLRIERTVDFFVIGGFFVFALVIFHLYITNKRTERKVEELARSFALKNAQAPKKRRGRK